ncbi:MAG TPA: hypothetical protein VIK11_00325 [Tepidiformaceae bacterium]
MAQVIVALPSDWLLGQLRAFGGRQSVALPVVDLCLGYPAPNHCFADAEVACHRTD